MNAAERELAVDQACREAGLSPLETEALHYLLVEGERPARIQFKLRRDCGRRFHGAAFREMLTAALYAVAPHLPGYWDAAREFPRWLCQCVANRSEVDDRAPGVCGVNPAAASQRFQGARMVTPSDARLRQDVVAAGALWAQSQVPAASAVSPA